jgi:hypothetical protein
MYSQQNPENLDPDEELEIESTCPYCDSATEKYPTCGSRECNKAYYQDMDDDC